MIHQLLPPDRVHPLISSFLRLLFLCLIRPGLFVTLPNFVHKTLNTLSTIQISVADVESIIGTLDINKAIGSDQISHKLLNATKHSISKPLCRIFNKSLDQETFPQSWKQSIVMPLLKKGENLALATSVLYLY